MKQNIQILAIESSCDETAAAVIGVSHRHSSEGWNPVSGSQIKSGMTGLQPVILSSVISSQVDLHAKTGGVVPEVASRAHMEAIVPVITEALLQAKRRCHSEQSEESNNKKDPSAMPQDDNYSEAIEYLQKDITHIAVTAGPGLIGSLLVGFNAAKTIAYSLDKPIIAVNHIEGHIYSAFIKCHSREGGNLLSVDPRVKPEDDTSCQFPILALTVSGGHTSLTLMIDHCTYETIGETLDDAAGEAFDKVAKLLGLGYPGGPIVSKYAASYREKRQPTSFLFPRPILNDGTFNFSFSGLKTAVLQHVLNIKKEKYLNSHPEFISGSHDEEMLKRVQHDISEVIIPDDVKQEICAAFEDASVDVLTTKAMRAVEKYGPKTLVLAGGVAANKQLRNILKIKVDEYKNKINLLIPPIELCGDNAAMIGIAAFYHLQKGDISTWGKLSVDSNLEIGNPSS